MIPEFVDDDQIRFIQIPSAGIKIIEIILEH